MSQSNDNTPSLDLDPALLPRHVAVIMDGNGRWARERELSSGEGHSQGAQAAGHLFEECVRLKIEQLTLYCFSSENWKRPEEELEFLMALLQHKAIEARPDIMKHNIVLRVIGRMDGIPEATRAEVEKTIELSSKNTGTVLCLAINYGGRGEIVDATRAIAAKVVAGKMEIDDIDEQSMANHLYTAGMHDPDLMIRTASEFRISNFLLWQLSYSELWITDKYWPDFDIPEFHRALRDYASRERRFGGRLDKNTEENNRQR